MQGKASVPAVRFAGFSDTWEQRKVGEILSDVERPIAMQDDETYQLVTVKRRNEGIVSRGYFKGKNILVKNYYRIKSGDFLISKRQVIHGATGYVPEELDNAVVSNEYMVAVGNEMISSEFWALMSRRREMYKMYLLSSYGVDIEKMVFNVDDWKKRTVIIPQLQEQKNITTFFSKIDHLIDLHQRKYSRLCNIKKSMLERMFPREGTAVPEIRFAGFTDAWEQRKLGELVDVRSGKDYKHLAEGDIPVYGTGGYMLSVCEALSYDEDAVGIGRKGTIDRPYILKAPFWTVDTLFYAVPREKVDLNFIFDIFQNVDWKKKDESTGVPSLSKTAINEIDVLAPHFEEQQAISTFFRHLDHLITLHQRELERLQNIKKSCLEKMFV